MINYFVYGTIALVETAIENNLTEQMVNLAKISPIMIEMTEVQDDRYLSEDSIAAGVVYPNRRFFTLHNCPVPFLNGRFYESGMHGGAPIYKNIRDWYIMRHAMSEIPEIGIVAENSYQFQEGSFIDAQYHANARKQYFRY